MTVLNQKWAKSMWYLDFFIQLNLLLHYSLYLQGDYKWKIMFLNRWMDGMDGWMDRFKRFFNDCHQQSKIISVYLPKIAQIKGHILGDIQLKPMTARH